MPRRNGTGPMGMGSRTGRGLGTCTDNTAPGFDQQYNQGFGRGFGMRNGMRNGMGNGMGNGMRNGMGGQGFGFRGGRGGFGNGRGMNSTFNNQYTAMPQDNPQALKDQAAYLESELKTIQKRIADMEAGTKK